MSRLTYSFYLYYSFFTLCFIVSFLSHNLNQVLFSCLLLVCYRLALTLTSTAVVLGTLTAQRKSQTVANAALASDVHKALNAHRNLGTELAFHLHASRDEVTDELELLVSPILNLDVDIYANRSQNLFRFGATDSVDVGQADFTALVPGEVNTCNTCHYSIRIGLALTLLELRIFLVNDVQAAFAADNFAVRAALFEGCSNFHRLRLKLQFSSGKQFVLWSNHTETTPTSPDLLAKA